MTSANRPVVLHAVLHLPELIASFAVGIVVGLGTLAAEVFVAGPIDLTSTLNTFIASIGPILTGGAASVGAFYAYQSHKAASDAVKAAAANAAKLEAVAKSVDGVKTELVAATLKQGRAEGLIEGRDQATENGDHTVATAAALADAAAAGIAAESARRDSLDAAHAKGVVEGQRRGKDEHPDVGP